MTNYDVTNYYCNFYYDDDGCETTNSSPSPTSDSDSSLRSGKQEARYDRSKQKLEIA